MMSCVRRLYVLLCGYEILPKTISTRNLGARFIFAEPVCSYLLDTESGWVLLDAGLDPGYASDPVLRDEYFLSNGWAPPVSQPGHSLEAQLAEIGIGTGDIAHVILSHLHFDHCARLDRFADARLSLQRREYDWAFGADPGPGYIRRDYDAPQLRWDLVDGDWQAMPGIDLIATHGHTEGHQSALISFPSGRRVLLPFDAGDLAENFEKEILPGQACDDAAALASIRKLKQLRDEQGAEMLLFHDPVAIQKIRLAPLYYD